MEVDVASDESVEVNPNYSLPHSAVADSIGKPFSKNCTAFPAGKGHEITVRTIRQPQFAYVYLELISDPMNKFPVDIITFSSHLSSAFKQFLGLTGSAIPVDILKVEGRECWIRIPRDDLSTVIAAVTGWLGNDGRGEQLAWKIKGSGSWLIRIAGSRGLSTTWGNLKS